MPKFKNWKIVLYILIFFGFSFGGQLIFLLTDYFWFKEIAFEELFSKKLLTKIGLGTGAALLAGILLWLNSVISNKISKKPFVVVGRDVHVASPISIPQLEEFKPLLQTILIGLVIMVAFFIGNWASGQWETTLKFFNGVPFKDLDPIFNRDIGFYIFNVPFYRFIYNFALAIIVLSLIISIATYVFNARIYFTTTGIEISEEAKTHLSIIGGFLCILLAFSFQLKMFDLLYVQRSLAPGAGYADINAYLPGLKILRFIALGSAILLWISPWVNSKKLMFGSVLMLVLGSILARAYAEIVQKFQVAPNEIVKETPYIKLGIENTRKAYGLTEIQELQFDPQENLDMAAIRRNSPTISNIRLWEHQPLLTSYGQLQEIRTYYDFLDADNDRYYINGEYRQVMLSVRELVPESLPSRIWINEHLTYTHGYGLCLGPVNQISPEGLPEFFIKDIPPVSNTNIKVTRPQIYFGETGSDYTLVNTLSKEFDYPSGDENVYTTYDGSGGVTAGGFLKRLLFAIRFAELKILFSGDITPQSRFIYYKSVRERLIKAAPFVRFESDPYIVVTDEGHLYWIVDGYSVTDRFPYSESTSGINYVRNSIKATVDAYNGTISLYISEPNDPIIKTYQKIFPTAFKSMDEMPEDLKSHIRYPQTLMNIQARIYSVYHMTDPQVFYNKEDLWKVPLKTTGGRATQMEPYYTIMKLAGEKKEEFILMIPFTPAKKENMIAWMAGRCDAPNYGKLLVYNFPKQKLVYGPQQIDSRIDQDATISQQLTLWDQGGSRVFRGNMLVIPVEESLLYVQPLYLEASGGGLPELKRVIVAYGNSIAMEENLDLSLEVLFEGRVGQKIAELGKKSSTLTKKDQMTIRDARRLFEKAQSAARRGDWAGFGQAMSQVEKILKHLDQ